MARWQQIWLLHHHLHLQRTQCRSQQN
eukprot:COSAG01_NODE_77110_length_170_cov_206.422535_1_plen_26_part_01